MIYDLNERPETAQTPTSGDGEQSGFNPFAAAKEDINRQETGRRATGATLNAQKLIGEGLEAVLVFESDRRRRSEQPLPDEALMQQVMEKQNDWMHFVGRQSKALLERLSEAGHDVSSDAIKARVTSEVAHYTATFYKAVGDKVFEVDVASELEKAQRIDGLHTDNDFYTGGEQSIQARRTAAMLRAMDPVMSAYQRFDYLHRDQQQVMGRMREMLEAHVDATMERHPAIEQLSQGDQQALEQNLLYRAGRLLGQCWESHISEATNWLRSVPSEVRRDLYSQGYPLESIEQSFSDYYRVIEQTTLASLSANMDQPMSPDASQTPSPS